MSTTQLIQYLFINQIRPDPNQPRKSYDPEALRRLAETIKAHGVQQPLRVRANGEDSWILVFGERRWRAAELAGLDMVPAIVEEELVGSVRLRRLVENVGREDLRPLELAEAIEEVMAHESLSAAEVARRIGLSEGHVSKLRALRKLPAELQKDVGEGRLSIQTAYGAVSAGKATAAADQLARKIRSAQRSVRTPRKKITLPVETGCSVAVIGPDLSMQSLVGWLAKLTERARLAESNGLTLEAFVHSLREAKPIKKAGAA